MANSYGPQSIVQDGLIFVADAGNTQCYTSGSATANDIVGSKTITLVNGAAPAIQPFPNSWEFDGTDDYMTTSAGLAAQNNRTIMFWIYPTDYDPSPSWNQRIVHNYDGTKQYQIILSESSQFKFGSANLSDGYNMGMGFSTRPALNTWTHVACVVDGSPSVSANYKVYYSGSEQSGTESKPGAVQAAANSFNIAAINYSSVNNGFFDGKLGCFYCYNRALTEEEITQNYNVTKNRFQ